MNNIQEANILLQLIFPKKIEKFDNQPMNCYTWKKSYEDLEKGN